MEVHQVIETPEGKLEFQGTLSQAELKACVEVGLNYLLQTGSIVRLGDKIVDEEGAPRNVKIN